MTPATNLIVFAAAVAFLALLLAPRVGLVQLILSRRRDLERIHLEDSLKYLYDREGLGTTAGLANLADTLRLSSARTLTLVERMQRAGLASVVDGRILLSAQGRAYALEIIRAHRLWERYLADETGVDPVRWHALADRREHALTRGQADELSRRLGNPRFDPHGDPIPTSDGNMPHEPTIPLTQLSEGETARVVHVEDEPDTVFGQLVALGVYPGMELRVVTKSGDRLSIESDGRQLDLSPIVAANVAIARQSDADLDASPVRYTLDLLRDGEAAVVARISPACRGLERRRLMDLGILPGTRIEHDRRGLTGGLTSYVVRGTRVALRDEQAKMISIQKQESAA